MLEILPRTLRAAWPSILLSATDDWLAVPEDDLREGHAEACDLFAAARQGTAVRLLHARSVVLLEQLLVARAVQRARGVRLEEARASLRGDHALGYFFGLAASGGDPTAAPPTESALSAALRRVHALVFGLQEAHRLAGSGVIEVGAAFGDGLLAAQADLSALLDDGTSALPMGLLAGLPWLFRDGGDPTARPH